MDLVVHQVQVVEEDRDTLMVLSQSPTPLVEDILVCLKSNSHCLTVTKFGSTQLVTSRKYPNTTIHQQR